MGKYTNTASVERRTGKTDPFICDCSEAALPLSSPCRVLAVVFFFVAGAGASVSTGSVLRRMWQ